MLELIIRRANSWRSVAIDCGRDATAAEVIRHLDAGGDDSSQLAVVSRQHHPVAPGDRLLSSGIRRGDVVQVAEGAGPAGGQPARSQPMAELVLTDGSGARFPLWPGDNFVGRDAGHEVVLDDGSVSKQHARITIGETIEIADLGSTNGVTVNGRLIRGIATLNPGDTLGIGNVDAIVTRSAEAVPLEDTDLRFNRPPRVFKPFRGAKLEFPAPPEKPRKFQFPYLTVLATVLMGVVFYIVSKSFQSVIFYAFMPVLLVFGLLESTRASRKEFRETTAEWRKLIGTRLRRLEADRTEDLRVSGINHPPADQITAITAAFGTQLWERRRSDADFLHLRLGTGARLVNTEVVLHEEGAPALVNEMVEAVERTQFMPSAPLAVDLVTTGSVGIVGPRDHAQALVRAMVGSFAVLHSPAEVAFSAVLADQNRDEWAWLKWLPHARAARSLLGDPALASGDAGRAVLAAIRRLVAERIEHADGDVDHDDATDQRLVVFIDGTAQHDLMAMNELLALGARAGVHVVWLANDYASLPTNCGAVVIAGSEPGTAELGIAHTGDRTPNVVIDEVTRTDAERIALHLASLVDAGIRIDDSAGLPTRVSLPELFPETALVDSPDLIRLRWDESAARSVSDSSAPIGLVATIGIGTDGENLSLDLRADGPHALVAGTTGAGKSEFLQTLVSSLALAYSPARVNFLLVDYKGGAAFKGCSELPHTVGMVTDLDTHEVRRVLVSLEAELRRREAILNEAKAKDLIDMEKRRHPLAPPSLLIVVDEFAALVNEVPEFVDGVVNIAQRGRSLGLHLILATQRPAGVITDTIRANTNLRIALRVSDVTESTDVIASPIAAEIPRSAPGRAAVRIGAAELLRFQSAYVGGYTDPKARSIRVGSFDLEGYQFAPGAPPSTEVAAPEVDSDLKRIVKATAGALSLAGLDLPFRPWLDPLPAAIPLEDLPRSTNSAEICIGTIDLPEQQSRMPAILDLERVGSVLVYGASRSGKTVLLRTVAAALARRRSAEPVHVYAIDGAGRGLDPIAKLPVVGSVLVVEDYERVQRLLRNLRSTVDRRSETFARAGVSNLTEYQRASAEGAREARIVVLIDGMATFAATYDQVDRGRALELLARLVADGRSAGVHFVMTSDQRSFGMPQLANTVQHRIVLRMANPDDYMDLDLPAEAISVDAPPGRGYLRRDEEMQVAVLGGSTVGTEQIEAIDRLAAAQTDVPRVAPVLRFPSSIRLDQLPASNVPGVVPVGFREADLQPAFVDLRSDHFLVFGPASSGKTNTLAVVARQFEGEGDLLKRYLVVARPNSPLAHVGHWDNIAVGAEAANDLFSEILASTDENAPGEQGIVIVADDLIDYLDNTGDVILGDVLRRAMHCPIRLVVSSDAARMKGVWLDSMKRLQRARCGLLLQAEADRHEDLLEVLLPRGLSIEMPPGRGYQVSRNGVLDLVQVAQHG